VVRGAILDVAVDVRRSSPTFGRHVTALISAENWRQVFVPVGFAHGFVTLEPNTEVLYKVSALYSPAHERGVKWNDPALEIDWGIVEGEAILSGRDQQHPLLREAKDLF
jgi:dTDP-4-dehydrorhamnose 3,5-epimerase